MLNASRNIYNCAYLLSTHGFQLNKQVTIGCYLSLNGEKIDSTCSHMICLINGDIYIKSLIA